jgi:putative ABC transport system ATP-binding protein
VYVTHEPEIARFASRILTIRDGLLAEDVRQVPAQAVVPELEPVVPLDQDQAA